MTAASAMPELDSPIFVRPKIDAFADLLTDRDCEVARRDFGERYEFRRILGEGGQGIVVAAEDKLLEREVAIKALKKRADPAHIAMLGREARVGATLEHPNILPTYDLGADEIDSPLLVMRKIEGQSLEERLKDLHQQSADAIRRDRWKLLNIFNAVLHAIEFAHSRGVLHLDLKPANVSLGAHGEIYVIDWGFARRKSETAKSRIGGTVHYISPERMDQRPFDERADVFALGVMLYRLLTGYHPRDVGKMSFADYRKKWRRYAPVPARQRDRSIAPELAAIADKAMAENIGERYCSVREMIDDLARFMEMLPVSAYRSGWLGRVKLQLLKRKRLVVASVIVGVLAALTFYALSAKSAAENQQRRSEYEKHEIERNAQIAAARRTEQMRTRYEARMVLKRAGDLLQKSRAAAESASTPEEKNAILSPLFVLFAKAESIDPAYAEIYDLRAQAHKLAFNWLDALKDYERAYELDSSYLLALYEAGMLLTEVFQQSETAREKFRMISEVSPNDEYAELGQAQVDIYEADRWLKLPPTHSDYDRRKELAADLYDQVLRRLEKIELANPALNDIWYFRGLIYQKSPRLKSPEIALAAYNRYLTARRDSPSAFHNRGDAKKDLGDIDGALADYSAAIALNPDFIWALRNRGYLRYKEKNDSAGALADINRAIALAPQMAWSYVDRGAVFEGGGDYEAAERDYERALLIEPENPRLWYRLGVAKFYRHNFSAAEQNFTAAIWRAEDEDAGTFYFRGAARLAQESYADAISDFETALAIRKQENSSEIIYPALMRSLAFKLWNQPLDGNDFGTQLSAPVDKPWLTAIGSVFLNEATEYDALKLANDPLAESALRGNFYHGAAAEKQALARAVSNRAVCETRFYLGAWAMANNDRGRAYSHFTAAVASAAKSAREYALAEFFAEKLRAAAAK